MLMRRIARPLLAAPFVVDGATALAFPGPRVKAVDVFVQGVGRRLPQHVADRLNSDPEMAVRANAGAQVVAGTLLALGKVPRPAAVVLAVTVIPSVVTEQDFWAEPDPERKAAKRIAFLKDVGLLGGLLIASGDTAGRPSLGWRGRRAAERASAAVAATLPIGTSTGAGEALREHIQDAVYQLQALSGAAATRGAELAETARARGGEIAETAMEYAAEVGDTLTERAGGLADSAKEQAADIADAAKERGTDCAGKVRRRAARLVQE
ncbi:DoxX family protein [Nocardia tengchongensis]|uniref:DoxX family protein n=1 Tax=Nocardia tengchongensis TaxID=2055889 RepID=A0ABX8CIL5_9NOCA|nr:DoxX family membrane protein [Nocardia tengchongensis]QVI19803.1 DoxX family protein [Nocardia tengchongensis]